MKEGQVAETRCWGQSRPHTLTQNNFGSSSEREAGQQQDQQQEQQPGQWLGQQRTLPALTQVDEGQRLVGSQLPKVPFRGCSTAQAGGAGSNS